MAHIAKAILIPVKEFTEAKKRLAPHFSAAERAALAEAMCTDFFTMIALVRGADAVFVVSKEPLALAQARVLGWETIVESRQISESDSVNTASLHCAERGVRSLLRVPIDLPLAEPKDIEGLLQQAERVPSAILVPSSDGTGTNALMRTPPALFPSHFGTNSFSRHLAEAERCGARIRIVRNSRLELDIDELADLQKFSNLLRADSCVARWLRQHGLNSAKLTADGNAQALKRPHGKKFPAAGTEN